MIDKVVRRDQGAALILVLIIISVISLVMSVILAQADTNVRATVNLRDQAANIYGADGATQAVLNALKTSGINCTDPSNPAGVQLGTVASPFYVPTSSVQGPLNAYAQCTPDRITGASTTTVTPPPVTTVTTVTPAPVTSTGTFLGSGDPTLPTYAVLTTGNAASDVGLDITIDASNRITCIENGSVGSNANINATGEFLGVRLSGTGSPSNCKTGNYIDSGTNSRLVINAAGLCKGGNGAFPVAPCTSGAGQIPTPAPPVLPASVPATNPAPVCDSSGTYASILPGLYTSISLLNHPCGGTTVPSVEWLSPGWYYFNYGSSAWNWPGTLIAGTPIDKTTGKPIVGIVPTTGSTLTKLANLAQSPGACDDPANPSNGISVNGSQLVFAGASVVNDNHAGVAEICASSPNGSPPVALYGLASDQTSPVTLPQETMCSGGCGSNSLVQTDPAGQTQLYIKGYVYAPQAQFIVNIKNTNGQIFNWGVVARDLQIGLVGSSPTSPVIHLPKPNTGVGVVVTTSTPPPTASTTVSTPPPTVTTTYTIRYINVWTCTVASLQASGLTSCPTSGSPNVQVRVLTNGASLQVLSWSNLR
jgi:Tfp pilus assembly protein PilX